MNSTQTMLLEACKHSLKVSKAWKEDENPDSNLKIGESATYDAACQEVERLELVIAKAEGKL